jgi:hypothetical protein
MMVGVVFRAAPALFCCSKKGDKDYLSISLLI